MATVASVSSAFSVAAGNKTLTATPTVRTLVVVAVVQTGSAVVGTLTDNNADGHGTYTAAVSSIFNASADVTVIYVRNELIQSGTSTTWTLVPGGVITGGGMQALAITGMTIVGAKAIRQVSSQINQPAASAPAPLFGIAPLTGNCMIGNVANKTNPATLTPPTSWTESLDTGYATTTPSGYESVFVNSGITASTTTWASTSASVFAAQVVEFDTRVGQAAKASMPIQKDISPLLQAVRRGSVFCLGDKWARRGPLWVPPPFKPVQAVLA